MYFYHILHSTISIFQNLVNPIKVVNIKTIMAMPFGKRQT